ncbi:MAG: hypothetical protein IJ306_06415 [Oscillospiraceae bacterium]|nr:hypothetical protein [Oscillospiraceae bacterium]
MEPEVIIMIAAFLCGVAGMAFAKGAKKKSSYPLLIASGFFAVLTLAGFIAAVVFIFFIK